MDIKKIGLIGGRGFVGQEILQLISQHEFMEITSIFSSSKAGESVKTNSDKLLFYKDLSLEKIQLTDEDAFILALPNSESKKYVDLITKHNSRAIIIDISSDHRFDTDWQYRVPELSEKISTTKISNPGCYASAMQFMLSPLVDQLVGHANLFGISGYSGAGASPNQRNDLDALKDNVLPYSLVSHLHEQEVKRHCYPNVLFTPHVGNFFRGIMITGNFITSKPLNANEAYTLFDDFYKNNKLISIQENLPNLQEVVSTSLVKIGGFETDTDNNRLTFCCVLDNLLKGAATQTVQNLNSVFGWEDNLGIQL
jgi:N-acetyl-gamma-glutamyl-phosphate reductase common form